MKNETVYCIIIFIAITCGMIISLASEKSTHTDNRPTYYYYQQPTYYIKDPCYNSSGEIPLIQVPEYVYYFNQICRCNNGT